MSEAKPESFLKDYAKPSPNSHSGGEDEYRAFSFGRVGSRSQAMITFVKQDDYIEAISYAKLDRVYSSDIETEIKLDFGDRQVSLEGLKLGDVFRYVCSNRCSEIAEHSERIAMEFPEDQTVVTKLEITFRKQRSG